MIYANPNDAFIKTTKKSLEGKQYGLTVKFLKGATSEKIDRIFDDTFKGKEEGHWGRKWKWRDFLKQTVFPEWLYEENGSIKNMLKDERLYDKPHYGGIDSQNSFFGRLCRDREGLKQNFMEYVLEHFQDKRKRKLPHFYFDIEKPEWVWKDLINTNAIKSWRTSVSCVMNMGFRWDSQEKCPVLNMVIKHCNWSHLYGDIYGGNALMKAFCDELGFEDGRVCLFMVSMSNYEKKKAKQIIQGVK